MTHQVPVIESKEFGRGENNSKGKQIPEYYFLWPNPQSTRLKGSGPKKVEKPLSRRDLKFNLISLFYYLHVIIIYTIILVFVLKVPISETNERNPHFQKKTSRYYTLYPIPGLWPYLGPTWYDEGERWWNLSGHHRVFVEIIDESDVDTLSKWHLTNDWIDSGYSVLWWYVLFNYFTQIINVYPSFSVVFGSWVTLDQEFRVLSMWSHQPLNWRTQGERVVDWLRLSIG